MGDSWPCDEAVPAGWLNTFSYGAMVDIDVIGKILPEAWPTKLLLSKYNDLTEEKGQSALNKRKEKRSYSCRQLLIIIKQFSMQ